MSMVTTKPDAPVADGGPRLRGHVLGFPQLLAQSIALISPTMTAVLIIPLAFGDAGEGTWAAYLFATVMLMFVVLGLNQFARRSTTAGSMYAYTGRGLGPAAGVMSGWILIWSYMFIAIAGLSGFAIFCGQLLSALGIHTHISPFVWFALSGLGCFMVAFKDVRLSAMLTLILEGLSIACILVLAGIILFGHGFSVDTHQLTLKGVQFKGMDFAIVVCIFSLVGFESATALGGEARRPLRDVPRAVVWSLILTGLFMVVMGYIEVYGTRHGTDLSTLSAPLNFLASAYGVSFFKIPVSIGAMVSFFSLTLSCLNAGARIIMPLGGHGFFSKRMHTTHEVNLTPHAAIAAYICVIVAVPVVLHAVGTSPLTIFDDAGTLAAFGFLTAYFLITFAAPVYLRKLGALKGQNVAVAVVACVCLMVPTIGSFYPVPPWPVNLFPYIFLVYVLAGGGWLYRCNRRQPSTLAAIERDLERSLEASVHAAAAQGETVGEAHPVALGGSAAPSPAGA